MTTLAGVCRAETVKIPITYREASEILPLIKTMLSPKGEAVADKMTNSLIITDNEESIQKIRAFLPSVDVLGKQVRIRVKFQEVRSSKDRSLSAGGSISDPYIADC
jgi:type II secretory pathway component HofQ